jgi:hypothetical protein
VDYKKLTYNDLFNFKLNLQKKRDLISKWKEGLGALGELGGLGGPGWLAVALYVK